MDKIKDKLTFSKIEILFIVVLIALVILAGIIAVSLTTRNKKVNNLKEDSEFLISIAKNAYASYEMGNKSHLITTSTDGTTKGLCFTIKGLEANKFINDKYRSLDGYIVIEENADKSHYYTIWITDEEYVINGYESKEIKNLSLKDGITTFNNDSFATKVKTSFAGTSSEKGGTGNHDGSVLKRYESACINQKVE